MIKYTGAAIGLAMLSSFTFSGCHSVESWDNDFYGNFDALWTIIDEHYCFFNDKDVDWEAIGQKYRSEIDTEWDSRMFFNHCASMLDELRDGHTNLISWFDVSYYNKWWSDYPQNFDLRLIEEHYLDFDYSSGSGFIYKYLEDKKVGYARYASFSSSVSDSFVDMMLLTMKEADGLILDIRNNGGGDVSNVEKLVSHFINERIKAGYITHKTGPAHNDFSEPYAFYVDPATPHVRWLKPVIILTNRSTFSAANNFVAVMRNLPHVVIMGATTGGGAGMPFSSELPCGWGVRFSASPLYDSNMVLTENGIPPTPGAEVDLDPELALQGIDTMIEYAISLINEYAQKDDSDGKEGIRSILNSINAK